jgi:hypothetical protein
MNSVRLPARILLGIVACLSIAQASVPFATYARVEKVVLEPNSDSPDTIQIWGVFSLADPNTRNGYLPPARGYLYFKLDSNPAQARKEWKDLKEAAGTGRIVAFGNRFFSKASLRKANEPPKDPDAYDLNIGLSEMRADTQYSYVRALAAFKD